MTAQRDRWRGLRYIALLLPLLLIWFAFRNVDLGRAWSLLASTGARCAYLVLPMIGAMFLDTLSWRLILDTLRRRIAYLRLLGARAAAEAVLLSVSGGAVLADALGPYLLNRHWGEPLPVTMASAALRKCALIMAQAFYLGLGVLVGYSFLEPVSIGVLGRGWLPGLALLAAVVLLGLGMVAAAGLTAGGVLERFHRLLARLPGRRTRIVLRRVRRGFLRTDASLVLFGDGRASRWFAPVGVYFLFWMAETLETFLILRVLGIELSFVQVWAFEPVVVLLRNVVFFLPGGLGVQELGYLAFLRAAGVESPVESTLAFSLLKRAREVLWVVIGYIVFAVTEGRPVLLRTIKREQEHQ